MSNPKLPVFSIRTRLLASLAIPLTLLCALTAFLSYELSEHFADEAYDNFLLNSTDSISARLAPTPSGKVTIDLPSAAQAILRHNNQDKFYYQVVDMYRHRLTGDSILPLPRRMALPLPRFRDITVDGAPARLCTTTVYVGSERFFVQVAETFNSRNDLTHKIWLTIVLTQLFLALASCAAVWVGIGAGLGPLRKLGSLLQQSNPIDLSMIQMERTPQELVPVVKALNDLFQGASKHMQFQRQFIADAAHQLKTPVTALKTYNDLLLRAALPADSKRVVQQMSLASNRLMHLTQRLLELARSESRARQRASSVNLVDVIDQSVNIVLAEALRKNIELQFDLPAEPVFIRGDANELTDLIVNLLENSVKYNRVGGSVWLRIEESPESVELLVSDDGPGIPEVERGKVFDRFYRPLGNKEDGCGLGLAIVKEIARVHGASVRLGDRPGGGTEVHTAFPRLRAS